jgi:hypothetical protein
MLNIGKPDDEFPEVTARSLLAALEQHAEMPLVFSYEGRAIKPGYHVTEVKTGRFNALDCGANAEAWTETFIQLWDVDEAPRRHMKAGKFVAIVDKVAALSPFEPDTRLTFEVSDGVDAIRLFAASEIGIENNAVVVTLGRRPASCKPRDRWLVEEGTSEAQTADQQKNASCCGPQNREPCCA